MFVCMYICMYVCMCVCVCVCMHVCVCVCVCDSSRAGKVPLRLLEEYDRQTAATTGDTGV